MFFSNKTNYDLRFIKINTCVALFYMYLNDVLLFVHPETYNFENGKFRCSAITNNSFLKP